jgi:hypothetical protein
MCVDVFAAELESRLPEGPGWLSLLSMLPLN